MKYIDLFNRLKALVNYDDEVIAVDDRVVIKNFDFKSNYQSILPGGLENPDNHEYTPPSPEDYEPDIIRQMLNKTDAEISENINFRYHMMMPCGEQKSKGIVLMFHGFNEKTWYKYLPWAYHIVKKTGKSVVFFPIAFHMNRAPAAWSGAHEMYKISEERKFRHPEVIGSSLSNVAISTRLHNKPKRFIWSGLQTYYDAIDFVENIKADKHLMIDKEATIDFCSYSIGTFLGQILMMTNKNGYFSKSKYATFCGGAVFNRLFPVSKFILDSEANVSLYSYVVEHIESHMKHDEILNKYLSEPCIEGVNFKCMLNYKTLTKYRETKFREMQDQFYAVTLAQDEVVPPYEVMNTMQGSKRDIAINVDVFDLPYKYKHEDPFPALTKIADEVDKQFIYIFDKISEFLK